MKTICYNIIWSATVLVLSCASPVDKEPAPAEVVNAANTADTIVSSLVSVTPFSKSLEWQKTNFVITAPQTAMGNKLTITPSGLAAVNDPITIDVDGIVIQADVDNLDFDPSAEILVVAKNESSNWATAYLFSVNNGKSLGIVSMPDWKADATNTVGVNGNNEFLMVEGVLMHRMPLTENGSPTGKWRQLQCKLKNGEASKVVVIDEKMEF